MTRKTQTQGTQANSPQTRGREDRTRSAGRGQARQASSPATGGQANRGGRAGQVFAEQDETQGQQDEGQGDQAWQVDHPEAQALRLCVDACNAAFAYLTQQDEVDDPELLACIVDCAELCSTTASFIVRGSEHADDLRETCADLAKCVEESCEEYEGDEVLTSLADACREVHDELGTQSSPRVG